MIEPRLETHLEVFRRGVDEILPEAELVQKLERSISQNVPLRIKQGFDPTAPDIHLGHSVGLRKLRDLQELGHQIILIVGDYTALVGDPSGRSKTRPKLTLEEIEANAQTYLDQFFRVIDREGTEVRRNGEWFGKMSFADILRLTSQYTVARLLERDDFSKRFNEKMPIGVHELLYPLMQGWDSVEIQADVEIGGTDQKFNLLVGRTLQEAELQEPQVILTVPLLVGLDGSQRMSKSLGNYVGVSEPANEQFGKLMSIPDDLIQHYWLLAGDVPEAEAQRIGDEIKSGALHPMEAKKQLAGRIVGLLHGEDAALRARSGFEQQFSRRGTPTEAYRWLVPVNKSQPSLGIRELLVATELAKSSSDARRKIAEGAVTCAGKPVKDIQLEVSLEPRKAILLRLGRRWVQVLGDPEAETPKRSPEPVSLNQNPFVSN